MSDHAFIVYLVAGLLCAVCCRIILHFLKIVPGSYWSILLGEGTEAIILTVAVWPIPLGAIFLWYILERWAHRKKAELKARDAERIAHNRANPMSTLSFDDLLKELHEQTKQISKP